MKNLILFLLVVCLGACSGVDVSTSGAAGAAGANTLDQSDAVCDTRTPEAGGDPSLCGVPEAGPYSSAGDIQMIETCDRPVSNPWWHRTDLTCTPEGFQEGRVWCCATITNAAP